MADHPLRPATRLSLGRPLPYQLADGPRAPLSVPASMERPAFPTRSADLADVCGISYPFGQLSPAERQITHVLLTRPPLYSRAETHFLARLACVRPAANVRSEPGSNSPINLKSTHHSEERHDFCYSCFPSFEGPKSFFAIQFSKTDRRRTASRVSILLNKCSVSSPFF